MNQGDPHPSGEITAAAAVLRSGGLVAFPTETVYGLGADARNPAAVIRIFSAKGRPADHPLIVHLGGADEIDRWARDVPAAAWRLAACFWPGPLTLILKRAPDVLDAVTGGQHTIGLRMPNHPVALAMLHAFGGGIAAPSANRFGRVSPTTAAHVIAELGNAVDYIMDGGPCTVGLESTILDLSGARPQLLRPGAITPDALAATLGELPVPMAPGAPRASGSLPIHYAPDTPLRLVEMAAIEPAVRSFLAIGESVAVLSMHPPPPDLAGCRWWVMPADSKAYAHVLYARLREADTHEYQCLLVERPPDTTEWEAVSDRLGRAAAATAAGQHKLGGA